MRSEISQKTSSGILEIAASTQTHIERLKSRVAELEKRLYGSRAENHQVMAEMKELKRIIHQRDQQVARLENEKRAVQIQVGYSVIWLELFGIHSSNESDGSSRPVHSTYSHFLSFSTNINFFGVYIYNAVVLFV